MSAPVREFFIVANSFAAPIVSDESTHYVEALDARDALQHFAETYEHPAGLFAAEVYASADDYHKRRPRLARWLSNKARYQGERDGMPAGLNAYDGGLEP